MVKSPEEGCEAFRYLPAREGGFVQRRVADVIGQVDVCAGLQGAHARVSSLVPVL